MLLEILSFWKCPSISVSEEQLLQKIFGNVSVKQPWWAPFPVYFLACLTLPHEFSGIFKVTSRQLINILSVITFDPRQHWFTGIFQKEFFWMILMHVIELSADFRVQKFLFNSTEKRSHHWRYPQFENFRTLARNLSVTSVFNIVTFTPHFNVLVHVI